MLSNRRILQICGVLAGLALLALAILTWTGHATKLVPVATVAVISTAEPLSFAEWAAEPVVSDNDIELSIKTLRPDPLTTIYIDASWDNGKKGTEVCSAPLSAPRLTCHLAPRDHKVGPGQEIMVQVTIVDFSGRVVQILPQRYVSLPGRSYTALVGGVALLIGLALVVFGVSKWRRHKEG